MKKYLFIICALPLLWWLLPKQEEVSENLTSLDELVPALMIEAAIPGLAVAKVQDGKVIFIGTYGAADIEGATLVTENTLFNIASISKPVMGVALLMLVDEGKLELDRDINDYLSFNVNNPKIVDEIITVRHLVTHSSGIDDYYDIDSYSVNQDSDISLKQHLISLLTPNGEKYEKGRHYLAQRPGVARKYSNLGAGIAGQIVEEISGLTLAEYSKQHLFSKLNMPNTSWLLHDLELNNIAVPYEVEQCIPFIFFVCADTETAELNHVIGEYFKPPSENKKFLPYPHFGNPQYPDGGIRTSIKEISEFLAFILSNKDNMGGNLLSNEIYEEMFRLQLDVGVSDSQRFFWRDRAGLTGHMGSDLGVFTAMYFDIKTGTGYIILMNRGLDTKAARAAQKIAYALMEM